MGTAGKEAADDNVLSLIISSVTVITYSIITWKEHQPTLGVGVTEVFLGGHGIYVWIGRMISLDAEKVEKCSRVKRRT